MNAPLRSSEIPNSHRRITCSWTFRLILHTEVCMDISSPFKPQVLSSTAVSLSLGLVVSHYHIDQKIASSIPHIYHLTGKPKQPDLGPSSSLKWPMCRLDHVFLDLDLRTRALLGQPQGVVATANGLRRPSHMLWISEACTAHSRKYYCSADPNALRDPESGSLDASKIFWCLVRVMRRCARYTWEPWSRIMAGRTCGASGP